LRKGKVLKISDFGHSEKLMPGQPKTTLGTNTSVYHHYSAPEIHRLKGASNSEITLDKSMDVFALECIFAFIMLKDNPFRGTNDHSTVTNILNGSYNLADINDQLLINLISLMVQDDPCKRPITLHVLQHLYFEPATTKYDFLRESLNYLRNRTLSTDPKHIEITAKIGEISVRNKIMGGPQWYDKLTPIVKVNLVLLVIMNSKRYLGTCSRKKQKNQGKCK